MAHFAQVDDSGVVRAVIVIDNDHIDGGVFPQSQQLGQAFITGPNPEGMALDGNWIQCSYSGSFRGCFAGLGYTYDPVADIFAPPTSGGAEGVDPGASLDAGLPLTAQGFDESGYVHDAA
jgi:hypothetical protein